MTPEQNKMMIDTSLNTKSILKIIEEMKKDIEKLEDQFKKTNDNVIENKMRIEFLDKRISDNYKNQKDDINGAFSKISHCSIEKEKTHTTEKEDIKKYINDKINISNSSLQNKFYVAILTAISGIIFAIIRELISK